MCAFLRGRKARGDAPTDPRSPTPIEAHGPERGEKREHTLNSDTHSSAQAERGGGVMTPPDDTHQYQSARGCLMMILVLIILGAITMAAIWFFGDHTPPGPLT